MSKVMEYLDNLLVEKQMWSGDVKSHWTPPEDLEVVKEAEEKTSYVIMGQLGSRTPERLDTADDDHSADYLVNEYKTAFGPKWKIWKEIDKESK